MIDAYFSGVASDETYFAILVSLQAKVSNYMSSRGDLMVGDVTQGRLRIVNVEADHLPRVTD